MKLLKLLFCGMKLKFNKPAVISQFDITKILSEVQIARAFLYYYEHKSYVDNMVSLTQNEFEPSQITDKNEPMLWKAEYWKWFLSNLHEFFEINIK